MVVKLLTEHHLEFLSLKGACRGSFESTLVKIPHCWKSHALAHFLSIFSLFYSLCLRETHAVCCHIPDQIPSVP